MSRCSQDNHNPLLFNFGGLVGGPAKARSSLPHSFGGTGARFVKALYFKPDGAFIVANVMTHTGKIARVSAFVTEMVVPSGKRYSDAKGHALVKADHLLDIVKETA